MTKTQDIRDAVEQELSYDPLIDMSDITVKNINGEVALNGTVPSFPQYLEAAAAARRVWGVKNVHNHLEVVLPPGDYRDDATLTTMANNALTLNIAIGLLALVLDRRPPTVRKTFRRTGNTPCSEENNAWSAVSQAAPSRAFLCLSSCGQHPSAA